MTTPPKNLFTPEALRTAASGKAQLTITGYASDWRLWNSWCAKQGHPAMPASPESVAAYVIDTLNRGCKVATVSRHLTAIASYHIAAGRDSPTSEGWHLVHGARRLSIDRSGGKTPLLVEDLERITESLKGERPWNVRARALLLLGFATALRESNLVALDLADLRREDRGWVVAVRREKNDQEGRGRFIGVRSGSNPQVCPVRALEAWLTLRGATPGPLFLRLTRCGRITEYRLVPRAVASIVKQAVALVGLDTGQFGGHSLRSGFVTQAILNGASETLIAATTGHRSMQMVRRYFRAADPFRCCAPLW